MKKILILGGIFVLVAGVVFVVLFTTSGVNYGDAVKQTEKILDSKELVAEVLNTKVDSVETYSETMANGYVQKVQETKGVVDELLSSKACADKYKDKCNELGSSFEKISKSAEAVDVISKFVLESKDMAGVSKDTLSEMKKSSNEFIQGMATDLLEYKEMVEAFDTKYTSSTDATEYVADYTSIVDKAAELRDKYTDIDAAKLYGASEEEILSFYDKVEELKNAFAEEK